ncbi:hypothetical protein GCM10027072_54870 [Streptomyces bullii]
MTAGRVGPSGEPERAGGAGDADVVGEEVVDEAGRGGSGALGPGAAGRDDVGAREGGRVDVLRADAGDAGNGLRGHRHLRGARRAAPEHLDLVGEKGPAVFPGVVEGGLDGSARHGRVDRRAAAQLGDRQLVVGVVVDPERDLHGVRGHRAVEGRVLRCEDRRPVVPALLLVAERDLDRLDAVLAGRVAEAVDGGLHAERVGVAVLQEEVVLVVLAVRGRGGLDEGAVDVAVQVEQDGRLGVEFDPPHRAGLGLGGGDEVPVEVEAVGVRAGSGDTAVGVGGDVEVEAAVREEVLRPPVVRGGEPLDGLQGGVGALPLVAVDVAVHEDRELVTLPDLHGLGCGHGRVLDELAHPFLGAGLAGGLGGGDGDEVEPVAAGRTADHLHAHPVAEALEGVQPGGDGVVRGEAELEGRVAGVGPVGGEGLLTRVAAGGQGRGLGGQGTPGRVGGGAGRPVVDGAALTGDGVALRGGGAGGEQQ